MSNFSKNLRFLRVKKGLRQSDLAGILNVTRATVNNYESGRSNPDFQTIEKIISYFNISTSRLLDGDIEKIEKSEILSNELETDIYYKSNNNESKAISDETDGLKWVKAISLFSSNYEAFQLYQKGNDLSYSLFEASMQVKEIFQNRIDLISERYGEKNPAGKDNSNFFIENTKELKKIEDFLDLYSETLIHLKDSIEKTKKKFKT